jgi:hypothetical protein
LRRWWLIAVWSCLGAAAAHAAGVTLTADRLRFFAKPGGPAPPAKAVTVETEDESLPVLVSDAPSWLKVSVDTPETPATLNLGANPEGLEPGMYTARLWIAAEGREASPLDVTLEITNETRLVVEPASLNLRWSPGGLTGAREISVTTTSGETVSFRTLARSAGSWLSTGESGRAAPASLVANVNAARLQPGEYRGTITLLSSAGNVELPVRLAVSREAEFRAEPVALEFDCYLGSDCRTQDTLWVRSAARPLEVIVSAAGYSRDRIWLAAAPLSGVTPLGLRVSVHPQGLEPGLYRGRVTLAGAAANAPLQVPVTLRLSGDPLLEAQPDSLSFSLRPGGRPTTPAVIALQSRAPGLGFWAHPETKAGGDWLAVATVHGVTPGTVSVTLKEAARSLSPGRYPADVVIRSNASTWVRRVPVLLVVRQGPVARPRPPQLDFFYQPGAPNNPSLESRVRLEVDGDETVSYRVRTLPPGSWLDADEQVLAPGVLAVRVRPPAGGGRQSGFILLESPEAPDATVRIPVTLDTQSRPLVTAVPNALTFRFPSEGSAIASQALELRSTGDPVNYDLSFTAIPSGRWLRLSTVTGLTPGSVRVEVDSTGLRRGTYSGAISVLVRGGNAQVVPVTVEIGR